MVGNVSLNSIDEQSKQQGTKACNLAILIGDRSHWGKGMATKIGRAVIDWAFVNGFVVIAARALEENIGSIRMLEKLGFAQVGTEPYEEHGKRSMWRNFSLRSK